MPPLTYDLYKSSKPERSSEDAKALAAIRERRWRAAEKMQKLIPYRDMSFLRFAFSKNDERIASAHYEGQDTRPDIKMKAILSRNLADRAVSLYTEESEYLGRPEYKPTGEPVLKAVSKKGDIYYVDDSTLWTPTQFEEAKTLEQQTEAAENLMDTLNLLSNQAKNKK
jgi:hypothetical protein